MDGRTLAPLVLGKGAGNMSIVMGSTKGTATYNDTLAVGATSFVSEPATWGLLLVGFGAMGFSLCRRRRSLPGLMQAVS